MNALTNHKNILSIAMTTALGVGLSHAALISSSIPTVGETGGFSDGVGDYFGIVTGGLIAGNTFSPNTTTPPEGALAGRDLDDGGALPADRTAEWSLPLPGGATPPMSSIIFNGSIAARDSTSWDASDSIKLELFIDGLIADSIEFRPNNPTSTTSLAEDTNADNIGDGPAINPLAPYAFQLSSPTTANTGVTVKITAHSDSANEEFWVSGTLSAEVDTSGTVPEPSSTMLLGLAGSILIFRRKK
ncbi:PEP-CTERM sorting domain-containing protein [Verrucomicrobiaceae bacterium N1E253]|uniref:PEP-CTERM sorting domain-containing protein n=1 Tax=Oceaniferula marina TaxID=2748318 RepID=A0A851GJA5_9BACT|nr:PEP-CTERM sorting domain-containing protein [Oceaniferula marina]NWK55951.1 PEP-CTERM sorting domain-containing protein [Oceaniferula marina]